MLKRQLLAFSALFFLSVCAVCTDQLNVDSQFRAVLDHSQMTALANVSDLSRLAAAITPGQRAAVRRRLLQAEARAATSAELAEVHRGYIALGAFDEALRAARTLTNAEPLSNVGYMMQAVALKGQGHYGAGLAAARESLGHPGDPTSAISFIMLNKSHLIAAPASAPKSAAHSAPSTAPLSTMSGPREKGLRIAAIPSPAATNERPTPQRSLPFLLVVPFGALFLLAAAIKKPNNWAYLREWVDGSERRFRWYGPETLETQEMMRSPAAAKMRVAFAGGDRRKLDRFAYTTKEAFIDTALNPKTADLNNTAFEVGGFANASVVNNGDGTATFTIPNVSGTRSFFGHFVKDRKSPTGPMSNIYQYFQWIEPIR